MRGGSIEKVVDPAYKRLIFLVDPVRPQVACRKERLMRHICTSIVITLMLTGTAFAATINVPDDKPTIQAAIDSAANSGDVILVASGTYNEHSLNPNGKAITIQGQSKSTTIIDALQGGSVFVIGSGEGDGTVIKDLTIMGGQAANGGGIRCSSSSPTINNCTIKNNTADTAGGGIYCENESNPKITGCTISDNTASAYYGGGIYCSLSNPTITDCTIKNNTASNGGGIYSDNFSNPTISSSNVTGNHPNNIVGPHSSRHGGGTGFGYITLENSTVCGTGEHVSGLILYVGENHIHDCTDHGDLDGDGDVDADDLNALHEATGICKSDVNHDGATDIDDLMDLIAGWGSFCP